MLLLSEVMCWMVKPKLMYCGASNTNGQPLIGFWMCCTTFGNWVMPLFTMAQAITERRWHA